MNNPKPTPPPRNRKARRKSSPGQVAFLEYKAVRDKAKAERKAKQRQDAHYLQTHYPEIAKAKREKGVKHNAEASAWRRQSFVLNPKTGRRKWKWCGCEKNFVKTEASVRKKLTELEVFRYNFRERRYFKCGSVEEAELTQRLAKQEAERRRLVREEAERVEAEKREAYWETHRREQQEVERKKAEAERNRLSRPAVAGWHDFIPEELKPTALQLFRGSRRLSDDQSLDDLCASEVERFTKDGHALFIAMLQGWGEGQARRLAEAVLVAD